MLAACRIVVFYCLCARRVVLCAVYIVWRAIRTIFYAFVIVVVFSCCVSFVVIVAGCCCFFSYNWRSHWIQLCEHNIYIFGDFVVWLLAAVHNIQEIVLYYIVFHATCDHIFFFICFLVCFSYAFFRCIFFFVPAAATAAVPTLCILNNNVESRN